MPDDPFDAEAPPEYLDNGGIHPDWGTAMSIFDLLDHHPDEEPPA
jgi:hypothetical protein